MKKTTSLHREDKKFLRSLKPTIEELRLLDIRRQYAWYRKQYFGNRVPLVDQVSIVFLPDKLTKFDGESNYGFFTALDIEDGARQIFIAVCESLERFETYRTLLHEMAHVSVDRVHKNHGHGKMFQTEMKRLARTGAMKLLW